MANENIEHSSMPPQPKGPVDSAPDQRPGVPMETTPPHPMPNAHWARPEQQDVAAPIFVHRLRKEIPPVFGTAQPPKGLSGQMRKLAYNYPDHWARHWLMLMIADRVDVLEHRLASFKGISGIAALAGLGYLWRKRARIHGS